MIPVTIISADEDAPATGVISGDTVYGQPDAVMMARIRAAPAILIGYEQRRYARCPECGSSDRPSQFATVDGVDYCRECGAEFDDTPAAWDDDADYDCNLREPVAPVEGA